MALIGKAKCITNKYLSSFIPQLDITLTFDYRILNFKYYIFRDFTVTYFYETKVCKNKTKRSKKENRKIK